MQFQRYAIFYTPPEGALADFGAAWLGWDIATGMPVAHPYMQDVTDDIAALTEAPRKYGLHGTIKPPFRLTDVQSEEALLAAFTELCMVSKPVSLDGLEVTRLGRFLALTVTGDTSELGALAANFLRKLDGFRAFPTEAEVAKRQKTRLTLSQEANLQNWGYPYALDDFRFHMTLTGKLPVEHAETLKQSLTQVLVNTLPKPFVISSLTLVGENTDGRFMEIKRQALQG
ncbi:DUF1045 domain-containing protein [Cognatishimia sp. WU-CL00825]